MAFGIPPKPQRPAIRTTRTLQDLSVWGLGLSVQGVRAQWLRV